MGLHINWSKKVDIENKKVDIEDEKIDINSLNISAKMILLKFNC